jgi:glutathione S-transferase
MVAGLRYSFPGTMARPGTRHPCTISLHDRVAGHRRLATYLASPRRIPFNRMGIFRRDPELKSF